MNCSYNIDLIPAHSDIETLPDGVCPVDWAKKTIDIARAENCGKSILCRDALTQIGLIIEDIVSVGGRQDDLTLLKELCEYILRTGGCAISERAAGNVLYSLQNYADYWDQHCRRKRCEALVCKSYIHFYCIPEKCTGCRKCQEGCPQKAITGGGSQTCWINDTLCDKCGLCINICEESAVGKYGTVKPRIPEGPIAVGGASTAPTTGGRRRRR